MNLRHHLTQTKSKGPCKITENNKINLASLTNGVLGHSISMVKKALRVSKDAEFYKITLVVICT
jgi:hypothetical protein